ncbi:MAG: 3'(2'),5'-bisphosphate nucleotidase, partial [Planctomycetaceae bacterium]|nr:3'(2'),5'-bisphosphate nucleotidase [Planctomycetaceae bacterium]
MSAEYSREMEVALQAVAQAALLCDSVQKKISPDVLEKKDRSPVTIADFGAQALVSRHLLAAFPKDPIIGEEDAAELREAEQESFREAIHAELKSLDVETTREEFLGWIDRCSAQEYSQRFWTLDPIDGTKGFLRKGQYAISLALIVDGKVAVAAVGCPNLPAQLVDGDSVGQPGFLFSAIRGQGTQSRSIWSLDNPASVSVSSATDPREMRFCESVESGHSSHGHSAQAAKILGIVQEPARLDSQ